MTESVICGDCLEVLPGMEAESRQTRENLRARLQAAVAKRLAWEESDEGAMPPEVYDKLSMLD